MNGHLIIAIGGTGQLALHYYSQLYLLGQVPSFDACVLDTDGLLPSLDRLSNVFDDARDVLHDADEPLPRITSLKPIVPAGQSVRDALQGSASASAFHPAMGYFAAGELQQSLAEGLFARPALSALASLPAPFSNIGVAGRSRVLTISSIIGGTGGGLTAPTLAALAARMRSEAAHDAQLRSVFFGEYFQPDNNRVSDAQARLASNALLVSETLAQLAPNELHSYAYITEARPGPRNIDKEREAEYLPWPEDSHPMWRGLRALRHLATDSTRDAAGTMAQRQSNQWAEVASDTCATGIARRVALVESCLKHHAISGLPQDPIRNQTWKSEFPAFVASLLKHSSRALPDGSPAEITAQIEGAVRERWLSLSTVFPQRRPDVKPRPRDVANVDWLTNALRFDGARDATANRKSFLALCSAVFLVTILRGAKNVGESR